MINLFALILLILSTSSRSLGCLPSPGDEWFVESLIAEPQDLPPMFAIKDNQIVPTTESAKKCILLNTIESYQNTLEEGAQHRCASSQIRRDDRPNNVIVPKNVECKIRIFCEPKIHKINLQVNYLKSKSGANGSEKYYRIETLDKNSVPKDIDITQLAKSPTGHDYYGLINKPDKKLCTMGNTGDRVRVDYLMNLYYNKAPETLDSPPPAPLDFSFNVKCYTQEFVINAALTYSLKKNYIPDLFKKGVEACARIMKRKGR